MRKKSIRSRDPGLDTLVSGPGTGLGATAVAPARSDHLEFRMDGGFLRSPGDPDRRVGQRGIIARCACGEEPPRIAGQLGLSLEGGRKANRED
jgi:hypothetical protein